MPVGICLPPRTSGGRLRSSRDHPSAGRHVVVTVAAIERAAGSIGPDGALADLRCRQARATQDARRLWGVSARPGRWKVHLPSPMGALPETPAPARSGEPHPLGAMRLRCASLQAWRWPRRPPCSGAGVIIF